MAGAAPARPRRSAGARDGLPRAGAAPVATDTLVALLPALRATFPPVCDDQAPLPSPTVQVWEGVPGSPILFPSNNPERAGQPRAGLRGAGLRLGQLMAQQGSSPCPRGHRWGFTTSSRSKCIVSRKQSALFCSSVPTQRTLGRGGEGALNPNSCTAGGYLRKSVFPCAFHTTAVVYD